MKQPIYIIYIYTLERNSSGKKSLYLNNDLMELFLKQKLNSIQNLGQFLTEFERLKESKGKIRKFAFILTMIIVRLVIVLFC